MLLVQFISTKNDLIDVTPDNDAVARKVLFSLCSAPPALWRFSSFVIA